MSSTPVTGDSRHKRLPRHELLALMDHSRDFSLTLIQASAGSGKTTLLRQWQQPGAGTVLLSLSRRDAEPARFFRRLGEALREVVPGFDAVSYNDLSADIELPAEAVAESLLDALTIVAGELFVLIDDFHHADTPLIQAVFSILLDHLPPQVHFIIATRVHPGFSLSRLKLEDRLLQIDGHDLRLTPSDVLGLGRELGVAGMRPDEINHLLLLTQGWVAGVKMALIAQSSTGRLRLDTFDGSQPELVDYFAHAVLSGLPERLRRFLLETSLFDSFSVGLCEELLGLSDACLLLEQVQGQSLFIHALEEHTGSYRYHPLFQNFLQSRLRGEEPQRAAALHAAAAGYFLNRGDEESALAHARQCRDEAILMDTLRQSCERWMRQGRFMAVIRAIEPVPDTVSCNDPGLMLPLLAALILSRRFNQSRYYLDLVRGSGALLRMNDAEQAQLLFLEKMLLLFQHDSDFWSGFDRQEFTPAAAGDIRAFSLAMLARYHLQKGECRAALEQAQRAKVALAQLGYDYLASFADIIGILADRYLGNMLNARQQGMDLFERYRDAPETPCWINAGTAMSVILYEQNRLGEAQQLLEQLIAMVDSACATENVLNVYLVLSRLLSLQGQHTRASRLLAQLRRILGLGNYDFFVSQLCAEEMRQAIQRGQHELVERIAGDYQLPARLEAGQWRSARPYDEAWIYYGLAAAHYLRYRGRLADAEQVLAVLSACLHGSQMRARTTVVDANRLVLKALQGQETAALKGLHDLVMANGLQCFTRTTYDEAPGLAELMARTVVAGAISLPDIYLAAYQDLIGAESRSGAVLPLQGLTLKEREVLELLRRGLSNKEISRRTNISLSTTKWHLKNIFAKLGVSSRTSAALCAMPEGAHELSQA